jgi:hypothetical protein
MKHFMADKNRVLSNLIRKASRPAGPRFMNAGEIWGTWLKSTHFLVESYFSYGI